MKYLGTMYKSVLLKQALMALTLVLYFGQLEAQAIYGKAAKLIANEKYSTAVAALNTYLINEPKDEKAEYLLGKAYLGMEKYGAARAAFKSGAGHGSRYPMNHVGLGAVAVKNKNYEEAKERMTKAIEVDRKNSIATLLGIAEGWLGYPDKGRKSKKAMMPYLKEAELYLYKVQKLDPQNAASFVMLGELYDLQGVKELAESNYEAAIARDPKYIRGYFRLGQLYKEQEKYNEAADKFRKIIELDAEYAPAFREMSEMWFLAKKYTKANEMMDQYLQLMGNDLGARLRKGVFEYLGEQYDKAIVTMEEVLPDTNSILLLRLIGYSYVKKETPDPDKSIEWLNRYFKTAQPISYIASDYENMAKALELKGDKEGAVVQYEKAMKMSEEAGEPKPEILSNIADMYKADKNYEKQAEYLERFLHTQKSYRLKQSFGLGLAYFQLKNYTRSDSVFQVMTEAKPDITIGWAWRAKNNSQLDPGSKEGLAKPYYEKVLEIVGEDPELIAKFKRDYITANKYLGAYYTLVTEEYAKAIPHWEKILTLKPEDEGATNGLNYCKDKG
ncbi:MAG TPA: tetratricopeptide repeat protein [Bacteroidetes bacterium]|nr:tetratricopeptide repeat protein [Bacteroidota bacterium]